MKQLKILITIVLPFLSILGINAQQTMSTTGGEATGTGGSSSYTVGQVVYTTNTGSNGSVAQGVQQPYEISATVGIEVTEINLELVTFPNPTTDALTLHVGTWSTIDNQTLSYQLFDMQGKLLDSKPLVNSNTIIGVQNLPANTYLLHVLDNKTLIKTFTIVKN